MNVSAIIAEYNPLHKGHVYHINKTKELTGCDGLICIMSGNFVQRGIPAFLDKWTRTKMVLESGVDLVIELPLVYSVSSAEFFSWGAISLLNNLGVVKSICFGSEYGGIDNLLIISSILQKEPNYFKLVLKNLLDEGLGFPKARSLALQEYINTQSITSLTTEKSSNFIEEILNSSNNILGIEYCKSILKLNSNIKPYTIKRQGALYNSSELEESYSSATSIRNFLRNHDDLSSLSSQLPNNIIHKLNSLKENSYNFVFEESMVPFLKYKALTQEKSMLNLPDVKEGLNNKIIKSLYEFNNYYDILNAAKSKRYTATRLSRILCQFFIGFDAFPTEIMRKTESPYGRILGFNKRGRDILKEIKNKSTIPLHTKFPKDLDNFLSLDLQGTKAYSLLNTSIKYNYDYLVSPIVID